MKKILSLSVVICIIAMSLSGCIFNKISTEEDIIGKQLGGYLYTSQARADTKDERDFLKERNNAVNDMLKSVGKTAGHSFTVISGFEKYENNLVKYIGRISSSDPDVKSVIEALLRKMTAYKTIFDSYKNQYKLMSGMKTKSDAAEAVINTHLWSTVNSLVDVQNEYLNWLRINTGTVASILGAEDNRQSKRLISSSETIYKKNISGAFEKMVTEFEASSVYNSIIQTADYYSAQFQTEKTADNLGKMKSEKTVDEETLSYLEGLHKDSVESITKPPVMIPVPGEETFSFSRRVLADGETDILSEAILVLNADAYEIMEKPALPSPENFATGIEESAKDADSGTTVRLKAVNAEPDAAVNLSFAAKNSKEAAAEEDKKRQDAISNINIAQTALSGAFFFGLKPETAYPVIIQQITNLMAQSGPKPLTDDDKNSMTAEEIERYEDNMNSIRDKMQEISEFIKTELEALIGENIRQFVSLVTNESAESLLSSFDVWKDNIGNLVEHDFTRDDLIDLLTIMGVDIDEAALAVDSTEPPGPSPSQSAQPSDTASPSPSSSQTPYETPEPLDPVEYDVFHILDDYSAISGLDVSQSNDNILAIIYGWTDPVDYGKLRREDTNNNNGDLIKTVYYDGDGNPAGWETKYSSDYILYEYHFPGYKDKSMSIMRYTTPGGSDFFQVETEDESIDRKTAVRYKAPGDPEEKNNLTYITQRQEGKKDGLNTTLYNSLQTFSFYDMDLELDSYTFKDGIMVRSERNRYSDNHIYSDFQIYYDSGAIKTIYSETDGEKDGTFTSYFENGNINNRIEYKLGVYNGSYEMYFEDGHIWRLKTYKDGELNGPAEEYYSDEGHPMHYKSSYLDDALHGIYEAYERDGDQTLYIEYKNGAKDGVYKDFATGTTTSESIHAFGQYSNDKKTGEWVYGYNNEGWVEKVYYDNDVKIWMEKSDGSIRTYYNPDGSVSHTEEKP